MPLLLLRQLLLRFMVLSKMTNLRDINALKVVKPKSVLRHLNGMSKMKLNALSVENLLIPRLRHGESARNAKQASVLNVSGSK